MDNDFSQLYDLFRTKHSFVITSHVNPDADAIGSETALAAYLTGLGKQVHILNHSETPGHLQFLEKVHPVLHYSAHHDAKILSADCIIVIDTNSPKRFSALADVVLKSPAVKVCIDHHLEHEPFADLYVIDTDVPAACELLYRIFAGFDESRITRPIADALYAGIMTDTGSFKFPKTDAETHTITADLLRRGADPYAIYQEIYESGEINKLHLLGMALERITLHHGGRIASMALERAVFRETGTTESDVDNLTQYVLSIKGVVAGVVLIEQTDAVKVSFRSKGDIAINTVAKQFGGGGHKNASGARLHDVTLTEARSLVIEKIIPIIP